MSFILKISFEGLCILVPRGETGSEHSMAVLLLDVPSGLLASNGQVHARHVPRIRFRRADLQRSDVEFISGTGSTIGSWPLLEDDIEIVTNDAALDRLDAFEIMRPGIPGDFRPTTSPTGRKDFRWFPELKLLYPNDPINLKPECLTSDNLESVGLVARFKLDKGSVSVDPSSLTFDTVRFIPASDNGAIAEHKQAVALRVVYELTVPSAAGKEPSVTLWSKRRKGGITLRPSDDGAVEVFVENYARSFAELPSEPGENEDGRKILKDSDFELIYRVISEDPPVKLVPELIVDNDEDTGMPLTVERRCFGTTITTNP